MNKNDIIAYSRELRDKKDILKKQVKSGILPEGQSKFRVVVPKQFFESSLEFQSDQWYFNGFVIDCDGKLIIVDPGVDFYSRFTSAGLSEVNIRALIITHSHIDHISSAPVFLEKILRNKAHKVDIFISKDAYETKISQYYKDEIKEAENIRIKLLKDDDGDHLDTILGHIPIQFVRLFHSCPDTFGFKLNLGSCNLGYISDTGYSIRVKTNNGIFNAAEVEGSFVSIEEKHKHIREFFADIDVAVVNINDLDYNRHSKYHLSGWDVLDLFKGTHVKKLVLQHISPVNAEGEDSNYLYKLFFKGESYEILLPHYLGRNIEI